MIKTIEKRLQAGKFVLIAEIGVNYYDIAKKLNISNIEAAKMMILEAKNAGIHAVKFQTYKAETIAAKNSPSYWDTNEETTSSQYALFKKYDSFGKCEYTQLANFCDEIGIEFCSTPFDFNSSDYLYNLMNVYKISSSDISNLPFISYIAKKNKPIILSIGAANLDEIQEAVSTIKRYNKKKIALLHCVLEYPTPYQDANLAKIQTLKKSFPDMYIGYSDHTKPDSEYDVIEIAYLLGAQLIEKHFTLDKSLAGNDHYHAMDVHDAEEILTHIEKIDRIKGCGDLVALSTESAARQNARRSIVTTKRILKGTIFTSDMLTFKRPGTGIAPRNISSIIGRKASKDLPEDKILHNEDVE